jgi:nicotinamide riboside kinase
MRIGFAGSQGTGKTSLARYMVEEMQEFKDFVFVPSSVRRLNSVVSVNKAADPLDQLISTVSRVSDEEMASDHGRISTISDRTPVDSLAYTLYQINYVWGGKHKEILDVTEGLAQRAMRDYDLVVYFPVYWPPAADGVRLTDPEYQKMIAAYITRFLNKYSVPYIIAENESVPRRAENIMRHLRRLD